MNLKNASLFHKLIFANILYSIPVLALVYLMVKAQNTNIEFARQELKGNTYQVPLEKMLKELGLIRINNNRKSDYSKNLEAFESAFSEFKATQEKLGSDLQFTKDGLAQRKRSHVEFNEMTNKWKALKEQLESKSVESEVALVSFISDLRTLITHAGDTSNLILDPDLDSYYLMDVTLLALPQTQDRIQDTSIKALKVLRGEVELNKDLRTEFAVLAALLKQSDLDRIVADTQTVLQEDPNFNGPSPGLKTHLEPAIQSYKAANEKFIAAITELSKGNTAGLTEAAFVALFEESFQASFDAWFVGVKELNTLLEARIDNLVSSRNSSLLYALLALMAAFSILFWVAYSFNSNISKILHDLKSAVGLTESAGAELVQLSDELSSASNEQSSAVQETASALEEISSMVKSTVDFAQNANQTAQTSKTSVQQGNQAITKLVQSIETITQSNDKILNQVHQSGKEMEKITSVIKEMGGKTKVINDIVFQTKLLSFNASVEAARAGEHGKGFAVVAEEVGNLAQMSGASAKEINDMVEGSLGTVAQIVQATQTGVSNIIQEGKKNLSKGSELASECGRSFKEIVNGVHQVKESIGSIYKASEEQSKGISEISAAINRLEKLTHQNKDMADKTAGQSKQLSHQSRNLSGIVKIIEQQVLGRSSSQVSNLEPKEDLPSPQFEQAEPQERRSTQRFKKAS